MKVTVKSYQVVDLNSDAVEDVFNQHLVDLGGGKDAYIDAKTGYLMEWEDTGHGSGSTTIASKKPTKVQIFAHYLKEAIYEERVNLTKKGTT